MITKVDVTESGVTTYNCQTNNDVNELKTSDKYKYCTASSMAYFRDGNNLRIFMFNGIDWAEI